MLTRFGAPAPFLGRLHPFLGACTPRLALFIAPGYLVQISFGLVDGQGLAFSGLKYAVGDKA